MIYTYGPGLIARYARGDDYHDVMAARLDELNRAIEREIVRPVSGKAYVDTSPILEGDLARKAGLGWFGKNLSAESGHRLVFLHRLARR